MFSRELSFDGELITLFCVHSGDWLTFHDPVYECMYIYLIKQTSFCRHSRIILTLSFFGALVVRDGLEKRMVSIKSSSFTDNSIQLKAKSDKFWFAGNVLFSMLTVNGS